MALESNCFRNPRHHIGHPAGPLGRPNFVGSRFAQVMAMLLGHRHDGRRYVFARLSQRITIPNDMSLVFKVRWKLDEEPFQH